MTEMSQERREELWAYLDSPFLYNAEPIETSEQDAIDPPTYGELRGLLRDSAWRERVERQVREWVGRMDNQYPRGAWEIESGEEARSKCADQIRAIVDTGDEEGA